MTDLVFTAPTVEQAFQDAVMVLGVDASALSYVILDQPDDEGRQARIAVINRPAGEGRGPTPEAAKNPSSIEPAWADVVGALESQLGVTIELDDAGDEPTVLLEMQTGAPELDSEVLSAVAHILERVASREHGGRRVHVESEELRRVRERDLCALALDLAGEVRQDGEPRVVPCRNSFERRIVHVALADVGGVRTASEGMGEKRQLVIFPDDRLGASEPRA